MQSLTFHTHVGKDGVLKLEMPIGMRDIELDVVLVIQPVAKKEITGWPPDFFTKTFGCLSDFPDRAPQGEYEIRNELE